MKRFRGGALANDGITLSIESGEIFGLLGPNGAGKTTLVSQVMGLTAPTSGTIELNGRDIVKDPGYARRVSAYQPQSQVPVDGLTPLQAITLIGKMRGGNGRAVRERATKLMESLDIAQWSRKRGNTLSGGVKRLVGFCMATVHPGSLVILDEPTNDVDPVRRRLLWDQVSKVAERGTAVMLVTHNVLEAEKSVDRLAVIDQGKVVAQGTPATLKNGDAESMRMELVVEPRVEIEPNPAFELQASGGARRIYGISDDSIREALQWASSLKARGQIEEYSIGPSTLEDAYIRLVDSSEKHEIDASVQNRTDIEKESDQIAVAS